MSLEKDVAAVVELTAENADMMVVVGCRVVCCSEKGSGCGTLVNSMKKNMNVLIKNDMVCNSIFLSFISYKFCNIAIHLFHVG